MLLNAFGWWKVSQITYIAALAAFGLGGLTLIASGFGLTIGRSAPRSCTRSSTAPPSRTHDPGTKHHNRTAEPPPAALPAPAEDPLRESVRK